MAQAEPKPQIILTDFDPVRRVSLKTDAFALERLIVATAQHPLVDPVSLASLVRSFCQLVQVIQELRGIPKPGQYRPDLTPQELLKAMKRIKERLPVDIAGHKSALADGPQPASAPPPKPPRKSLTTEPKNPLTKPPIEERLMNESALDLPDDETPTD